MIVCSAILFMARPVDFAVPLESCSVFSLSGEFIPTDRYLSFVTRRQAGSVASADSSRSYSVSELLMMRKEFSLVLITTNAHEFGSNAYGKQMETTDGPNVLSNET
jgi:hypothetical protein